MLVDNKSKAKEVNASKHLEFLKNKKFYTAYSHDILETLFEAEKRLIQIRKRSDQLSIRSSLIKVLQHFAKCHQYSLATLHLGIHVLDVYMDSYILSDFGEHQKLIGIVCLLLAAKSEDLDDRVPSIKDLLRMIDLSDDLGVDMRFKEEMDSSMLAKAFRDFRVMYSKIEYLVFESLDFNVIRPTAVSFVNIFQNIVLTDDDVSDVDTGDGGAKLGFIELQAKVNEYLHVFLEIILYDTEFFNIRPSKLAAAILGATRKLLHIKNFWPDYMVQLTGYKADDIRSLIIVLIDKRIEVVYHSENVDDDSTMKDSGFISVESGSDEDDAPKQVHKRRKLNRVGITYEAFDINH